MGDFSGRRDVTGIQLYTTLHRGFLAIHFVMVKWYLLMPRRVVVYHSYKDRRLVYKQLRWVYKCRRWVPRTTASFTSFVPTSVRCDAWESSQVLHIQGPEVGL